jgi:hypothetical protein
VTRASESSRIGLSLLRVARNKKVTRQIELTAHSSDVQRGYATKYGTKFEWRLFTLAREPASSAPSSDPSQEVEPPSVLSEGPRWGPHAPTNLWAMAESTVSRLVGAAIYM